jgi:hypothetical protein
VSINIINFLLSTSVGQGIVSVYQVRWELTLSGCCVRTFSRCMSTGSMKLYNIRLMNVWMGKWVSFCTVGSPSQLLAGGEVDILHGWGWKIPRYWDAVRLSRERQEIKSPIHPICINSRQVFTSDGGIKWILY